MLNLEPLLGAGVVSALEKFDMTTKLHPVLVNFTAALVPVSVVSDFAGRIFKSESLRNTGWWCLLYATAVTPLTALAGWLFWMPDDNGASGMAIHKWLGSGLALLLFGLFAWRWRLRRRQQWPTTAYLILAALFIAALVIQGHLGGQQTFSGM